MGEGGGGEEKGLFLFRFHFSPFPQKRLILRLKNPEDRVPVVPVLFDVFH